MIRLHSYHGTQNLGDAIQSLALIRLCQELRPDLEYGWVDRDGESTGGYVMTNGWLGDNWVPSPIGMEFCGVHCATEKSLRTLRDSVWFLGRYPIGVRDPYTQRALAELGLPSEMIGCATLTLPRYSGPREGSWRVDYPDGDFPNCLSLTHRITPDVSWEIQRSAASVALSLYHNAHAVYTSRLHVLLPCIAFGTPVALTHIPPHEERRFSLAKYLGVEVGTEPKVYDASELAAKFRAFTLNSLNRLSPP